MTDETIELTIKTTPKGLQELMVNMPGFATALQNAAITQTAPPESSTDIGSGHGTDAETESGQP